MIGATAPEEAGQQLPSWRYKVSPCISMGNFSCDVSPPIVSLDLHSGPHTILSIYHHSTSTKNIRVKLKRHIPTYNLQMRPWRPPTCVYPLISCGACGGDENNKGEILDGMKRTINTDITALQGIQRQ